MSKAEVNVAQLFYALRGKQTGPVVVLSNSLGTMLEMWQPQLAVLEDNFHLLRYDMRGHGNRPERSGVERSAVSFQFSRTPKRRIVLFPVCGPSMAD